MLVRLVKTLVHYYIQYCMHNLIKRASIALTIILAILAILYASVYGISQYLLSQKNIHTLVVSQLSNILQRKVYASRDLSFTIGWDLAPHVILRKVKIANADWSTHTTMLEAEEIDLVFSLRSLITQSYEVEALRVEELKLLLQTDGERKNWHFTQAETKDLIDLSVDQIIINNAQITLKADQEIPTEIAISRLQSKISISENNFNVEVQELSAGKSDLHGVISLTNKPLRLQGNIQSDRFRPRDFLHTESNDGTYSIPPIEIPVELLREAIIDLHVKISTIALDKLPIHNYDSLIFIKDQVLTFDLDKPAKIANGTVDIDISYNLQPNTPTLDIAINTSELDFATLLRSMFDNSPITGSKFNFKSNLKSSGADLNTLVDNLQGKILATASEGSFMNTSVDSATNIFSSVLSGLITFEKQKSSTNFKCGVLNLHVHDGVGIAKNGIGIEAATVKVLGSGSIDLRNGQLNLKINPHNTSSSSINMSDFSIAQNVSITGTIAQPNVGFNPMDLIVNKSTAKIATEIGGVITGGAAGAVAGSMLGSAMGSNKEISKIEPCKVALDSN